MSSILSPPRCVNIYQSNALRGNIIFMEQKGGVHLCHNFKQVLPIKTRCTRWVVIWIWINSCRQTIDWQYLINIEWIRRLLQFSSSNTLIWYFQQICICSSVIFVWWLNGKILRCFVRANTEKKFPTRNIFPLIILRSQLYFESSCPYRLQHSWWYRARNINSDMGNCKLDRNFQMRCWQFWRRHSSLWHFCTPIFDCWEGETQEYNACKSGEDTCVVVS